MLSQKRKTLLPFVFLTPFSWQPKVEVLGFELSLFHLSLRLHPLTYSLSRSWVSELPLQCLLWLVPGSGWGLNWLALSQERLYPEPYDTCPFSLTNVKCLAKNQAHSRCSVKL